MKLSTSAELDGKVMAEAFEKSLVTSRDQGESMIMQKLKKLTAE